MARTKGKKSKKCTDLDEETLKKIYTEKNYVQPEDTELETIEEAARETSNSSEIGEDNINDQHTSKHQKECATTFSGNGGASQSSTRTSSRRLSGINGKANGSGIVSTSTSAEVRKIDAVPFWQENKAKDRKRRAMISKQMKGRKRYKWQGLTEEQEQELNTKLDALETSTTSSTPSSPESCSPCGSSRVVTQEQEKELQLQFDDSVHSKTTSIAASDEFSGQHASINYLATELVPNVNSEDTLKPHVNSSAPSLTNLPSAGEISHHAWYSPLDCVPDGAYEKISHLPHKSTPKDDEEESKLNSIDFEASKPPSTDSTNLANTNDPVLKKRFKLKRRSSAFKPLVSIENTSDTRQSGFSVINTAENKLENAVGRSAYLSPIELEKNICNEPIQTSPNIIGIENEQVNVCERAISSQDDPEYWMLRKVREADSLLGGFDLSLCNDSIAPIFDNSTVQKVSKRNKQFTKVRRSSRLFQNKQKYNTSFNTSYTNFGKENIFNDTKGSIFTDIEFEKSSRQGSYQKGINLEPHGSHSNSILPNYP